MSGLNDDLENIYRDYREQLFIGALAITGCAARAEDAVEDAFVRLFRLKTRPQNLKAYVFRAVRNAAIDLVQRDRTPSMQGLESQPAPGLAPGESVAEAEFRKQVVEALRELSPDERETIMQHLYGGLTFREIAEIRETPLGTATGWYQRGLKKLRAKLEG